MNFISLASWNVTGHKRILGPDYAALVFLNV